MRGTEGSGKCFPPVIVFPPGPHIYFYLNTALIEQSAGRPGKQNKTALFRMSGGL
jgi:hypothetical protein